MPPDLPAGLQTLPVRLRPGEDLRAALEALVAAQGATAAFVLSGIGSLAGARLRLAGAGAPSAIDGDLELLSLSGTLGPDGAHLHAAVATADGAVRGGHVAPGCVIRTTAEVLVALLPGWALHRVPDAATGYAELDVRRIGAR